MERFLGQGVRSDEGQRQKEDACHVCQAAELPSSTSFALTCLIIRLPQRLLGLKLSLLCRLLPGALALSPARQPEPRSNPSLLPAV